MINLKINKISVITLFVIYLIVMVFHNWEYVWIFKSLFAFNIGYLGSKYITHWMPTPEPPEET
jgi:hypothetical protein